MLHHCREDVIFREGFKRGFADALVKADAEVERQARAAFAVAALDDEVARQDALKADLARLQLTRYQ
jgi:hypothetical protein